MELKDLNVDQREKLRQASTMNDVVAIAKEEGIELTDEQLETLSGGAWYGCSNYTCPENDSLH